jgi:hypothetical protein
MVAITNTKYRHLMLLVLTCGRIKTWSTVASINFIHLQQKCEVVKQYYCQVGLGEQDM